MKHSTLFFLSILSISICFHSCKDKQEYFEVPHIEYDVLINNYNNHYSWFDNIEGYQRTILLETIIDIAEQNQQITVLDKHDVRIENKHIKTILIEILHSFSENKHLSFYDINGLRFREQWSVNTSNGFIKKDILGIGLLYFENHMLINDSISEPHLLLWLTFESDQQHTPKYSQITKTIAYDVSISNKNMITVDTYGEKTPYYFANIEPTIRKQLVELFLSACFENKVPAYDYFFTKLSKTEISNIKEKKDTLQIPVPNSLDIKDTVIISIPNISNINRIKFLEQWEIDKNTLAFRKTVIAISPSEEMFDDFGNLRGYKPLFWLVFDEKAVKSLRFD